MHSGNSICKWRVGIMCADDTKLTVPKRRGWRQELFKFAVPMKRMGNTRLMCMVGDT